MSNTQDTIRLQVRITVTRGLKKALDKKAVALHLQEKDAIHQALVEWVAQQPVPRKGPSGYGGYLMDVEPVGGV